jgi:hypothetical protein
MAQPPNRPPQSRDRLRPRGATAGKPAIGAPPRPAKPRPGGRTPSGRRAIPNAPKLRGNIEAMQERHERNRQKNLIMTITGVGLGVILLVVVIVAFVTAEGTAPPPPTEGTEEVVSDAERSEQGLNFELDNLVFRDDVSPPRFFIYCMTEGRQMPADEQTRTAKWLGDQMQNYQTAQGLSNTGMVNRESYTAWVQAGGKVTVVFRRHRFKEKDGYASLDITVNAEPIP